MSTPIEVVTAFFAAFPDNQGKNAIKQWFTPNTVWVNEGVAITTGIDEAIALTDQLKESLGIATVQIEMLAIAADGNKILTERFDRFERTDGSEIGAAKVMGILEMEGDYIIAWRDYFDVSAMQNTSGS